MKMTNRNMIDTTCVCGEGYEDGSCCGWKPEITKTPEHINRTGLQLSVWDINRRLTALNELPNEVIECIPQDKLNEIIEEVERFKKFSLDIQAQVAKAKTWHRIRRTVNANA